MITTAEPQPLLFALDEAPSGWGELKPREQRFLLAYAGHGNAAKAAREAGYSEKAGRQIGSELLTRHDILRVLHQMSHKLGCSLDNKIVRQEQLAAAMAGIAMDPTRKVGDRISAARAAQSCDALLAGIRGQLKLRAPIQGDVTGGATSGEFQYTPQRRAELREQWRVVTGRDQTVEVGS